MKGLIVATAVSLMFWSLIGLCFAQAEKVSDNSLKMTVEQVYTYEDIQNRINSLKSERDGQQSNLNLLNAEIARLEKMIQDTGIKATEEKGE